MENPDVLIVLESKLNMEALCKLPHFEKWRKAKGYIYVYNTWSRHTKSGSGYAGVCVFSKIKPTLVEFGLDSESPHHEGRCVTLHFATQIVVGTYAQCSGYDANKIVLRRLFDGALKNFLAKKKE
jgi:exonuclease III